MSKYDDLVNKLKEIFSKKALSIMGERAVLLLVIS